MSSLTGLAMCSRGLPRPARRRDHQHHGLVQRQAFAEVPPRVEYALTDLGKTILEPVTVLSEWAERNGDTVLATQDISVCCP